MPTIHDHRPSTMTTLVPSEVETGSFFANILTPGSSFHPTFLLIVDFTLAFLAFVFVSLAVITGGNVHFIALLCIELGLWASIKWYVVVDCLDEETAHVRMTGQQVCQ